MIDASVAAKWFIPEPDADHARRIAASDDILCAPDLLLVETANVFWKACRQKRAAADQVIEAIARLPEFFDEIIRHHEFIGAAMEIALELDHPIYDCVYLALAADRQISLVTADRRLVRSVAGTVYERWVEA